MTGRRQRAQQTCKHSINSLILFPALADQDEPVRGKHTCTRWIPPDLRPAILQFSPCPGVWAALSCWQIFKACSPAAVVGIHAHTYPGALQELALDIGSTQQLAPRFPGLPVVLTHRCKLFSFSWSPDPRVAPGSLSSWLTHISTGLSQTHSHAMSWLSNLLPYQLLWLDFASNNICTYTTCMHSGLSSCWHLDPLAQNRFHAQGTEKKKAITKTGQTALMTHRAWPDKSTVYVQPPPSVLFSWVSPMVLPILDHSCFLPLISPLHIPCLSEEKPPFNPQGNPFPLTPLDRSSTQDMVLWQLWEDPELVPLYPSIVLCALWVFVGTSF